METEATATTEPSENGEEEPKAEQPAVEANGDAEPQENATTAEDPSTATAPGKVLDTSLSKTEPTSAESEISEQPEETEHSQGVLEDAAAAVEAGVKETVNSIKDLFKSPDQKESNKIFHQMDKDGSRTASVDEIAQFVASNDDLWAMLSTNLGQPPEVATKAATRVAMELATGLEGEEALQAELTKDQFYKFRMKYIKDPEGSQEFFHRAIFAAYDTDNNGTLDEQEFAEFLEIFYKSESIFKGELTLPPKDILEKMLLEKFDTDNEGTLSFDTIHGIVTGKMQEMKEELAEAAAKAEEEERLRKEAEEMAKREEEERLQKEAEEKAEAERLERERIAAEKKAEEERLAAEAEAARKAEEERLAAEAKAKKEAEEAVAAQKAEEERIAAEAETKAKAKIAKEEEAAKQPEEQAEAKGADEKGVAETKTAEEQAVAKKKEEEDQAAAKNKAEEEEDGCVFCEWVESLFKAAPPKQV